MDEKYLIYLMQQYLSGQLTAPQREALMGWLGSEENRTAFVELVTPMMLAWQEQEEYRSEDWDALLQTVLSSDKGREETPVRWISSYRFRIWGAAAAVVVLVAAGGYWRYIHPGQPEKATVAKYDVAPGGNRAVLTLSGGRKIVLDSTAADTVLTEGADIVANADGRLAYNPGSDSPVEVLYNTLTTPRGGQYQLTLADGTKVWLNAASSIKYPTTFNGKERAVTITGEAYLEVAHLEHQPFKVTVDGRTIEDLGTHFDINAYDDEPVQKVTLLEGAVKVVTHILAPGEQATIDPVSGQVSVQRVETDQVVAWVKGKLSMDSLDVRAIMRQVSRWYDVDVVYEGAIPQGRFWGVIDRNVQLSSILDVMEENGIHIRLDGKKVIVLAK
jgi:transmembrane sensor